MKPRFILCCVIAFQFAFHATATEKTFSDIALFATGVVTDSLTSQTLYNAQIVLYDFDKENYIRIDSEEQIIKLTTKMHKLKAVSTNNIGEYKIELLSDKYYKLIVTINGFVSQVKLFTTFDHENKVFNFNLENQEVYIANDARFLVKVEPIQFEINSNDITLKSQTEINKVVMLLKKYTDFVIEIGVHTSSLGNDSFNLNLSTKRATEIYNYIKSFDWPDKSRLTAVGYGETKPLNECVNGVKCSQNKHNQNKRVDFVLHNKYKPTSDVEYLNRDPGVE